jgi:hypothetical protein
MGTSEERAFEQEVASRTVAAMHTMNLKILTEQTYNEIFKMNIDAVVSMRKRLSGTETVTERMSIAGNRVVELLSDAGVNLNDLSKSHITAESSEYAYEQLIEHVAINEKASLTGLELVKYFFAESGVNVTSSMRGMVIKNILNAIGYTLVEVRNGRERFYNVANLTKKISINGQRIECNITEIANKYELVNLSKSAPIFSMKEIKSYGVVTESEKRLARAIEAGKNNEIIYDEEEDDSDEEE